MKEAVVCHNARPKSDITLALGPETPIVISSDAHRRYFLSSMCQLVFTEIFVTSFLSSFSPTKFTVCIWRDKRSWAWKRWTFTVRLKQSLRKIIHREA